MNELRGLRQIDAPVGQLEGERPHERMAREEEDARVVLLHRLRGVGEGGGGLDRDELLGDGAKEELELLPEVQRAQAGLDGRAQVARDARVGEEREQLDLTPLKLPLLLAPQHVQHVLVDEAEAVGAVHAADGAQEHHDSQYGGKEAVEVPAEGDAAPAVCVGGVFREVDGGPALNHVAERKRGLVRLVEPYKPQRGAVHRIAKPQQQQ
mmetsp:Transcript_9569/g.23111  ORF Transcript_9569/g.23111 Transcript_9569/m.23111 type:complete len:209 (+) Transcript_9569:156-782(+)